METGTIVLPQAFPAVTMGPAQGSSGRSASSEQGALQWQSRIAFIMCSKDVAATGDQSKTAIALAELGEQIRGKNFRQIFLFLLTQMLLKARFGGILSSLEASGNDYKNSSSSKNTHLPKTTRSSLRHSRAASILIMKLSASL